MCTFLLETRAQDFNKKFLLLNSFSKLLCFDSLNVQNGQFNVTLDSIFTAASGMSVGSFSRTMAGNRA